MDRKNINRYNWNIQSGDYISELNNERREERERKSRKIKKYIGITFTVAVFVIVFVLAFTHVR